MKRLFILIVVTLSILSTGCKKTDDPQNLVIKAYADGNFVMGWSLASNPRYWTKVNYHAIGIATIPLSPLSMTDTIVIGSYGNRLTLLKGNDVLLDTTHADYLEIKLLVSQIK